MFGLEVGGRWDELELQTKLCAAGLAPALSEPSLTPDGKRATAAPRPGPPVAAGSVVGSDCVRRWQKEKPRSWHCPWGKRLGCVLHIFHADMCGPSLLQNRGFISFWQGLPLLIYIYNRSYS